MPKINMRNPRIIIEEDDDLLMLGNGYIYQQSQNKNKKAQI